MPDTKDPSEERRGVEELKIPPSGPGRGVDHFAPEVVEKAAGEESETTAAKASRRTAYATICIAMFTVALAIVTTLELKEIKGEFRASHRPWLNVSSEITTKGSLVIDSHDVRIPVSYTLKNGGTTPAIGVLIFGGHLVLRDPGPMLDLEPKHLVDCDKRNEISASFTNAADNAVGFLILPGDTKTIDEMVRLDKSQDITSIDSSKEVLFPLCVRYRDDIGESHGTGVVWEFSSDDGATVIPGVGTYVGSFKQIGMGSVSY